MSGNTIELGDLSSGATEAAEEVAEEAAEADEGTGEFLVKAMEMMDDKGLLEPLLFGPESNVAQSNVEADPGGGDPGEIGEQVDAEFIADVGKQVIDVLGDVPMSEVVKLAEEQPEQVDKLVQQHLGGE